MANDDEAADGLAAKLAAARDAHAALLPDDLMLPRRRAGLGHRSGQHECRADGRSSGHKRWMKDEPRALEPAPPAHP